MNNLQSAMFNYLDWFVDPSVRCLDPATRDAYTELIWRAVAAWDEGFIAGPRDKRASLIQATAIAGTTKDRMQTLLDLGLVEVLEQCVFVQRGLDLLRDQDSRRSRGTKGGKAPRKNRPNQDQPESTQVNSSQLKSTQADLTQLDATKTGQDRTGQDKTGQDPISSSSEPKGPPAPARTRDETDEEWAQEICRAYEQITDLAAGEAGHNAVLKALKTHRATDLAIAIEGAKHNKWAQQHSQRMALQGIVSSSRIDGHIRDHLDFYGRDKDKADEWAETLLARHGGEQ